MTNLRTIDKVVISVIAVVITVTLLTMSTTPSNKAEDNSPEMREPVSASEPRLFDPFGEPVKRVEVGEQVLFESEITNSHDKRQPYVYIVLVKNTEGITISLSYMKSELLPSQNFTVSQSWIPTAPGKYDVEVFVWDSIDVQTILSPSRKISVEVES